MDNRQKFLNMLGLSRRAGKLFGGFDMCIEKLKDGSAVGIIAAEETSEKTVKNLKFEADKRNVPVITVKFSREEMSFSTGMRAGCFAVLDEGFYSKLSELAQL